MPIDKEKLRTALSTFQKTEEGYKCPSEFVKLWNNVRLNSIAGVKLPSIGSFLQYITIDLTNIETISSRLVWELELVDKGALNVWQWMRFAQCDIDVFHIEIRSIFDYLGKVIQRVSDHPENVPDKGFNDLSNWLVDEKGNPKKENVERFGEDLAKLVLSVDWFDDIKNVRDETLHRGADTMVFPEKGRILFQISKHYRNLVSFPEVQYNDNVIDFELYAGVYFGYLIDLLENASQVVEKRLPPRKSAYGAGNPYKGYKKQLPAIYDWIRKVLEKT